MSKSLGNSPDPIDLIEKFGADGVRMGMLLCSPAGNDIPFDESQVEQGRNFCNKIWNAFRLIKSWEVKNDVVYQNSIPIHWFEEKLDAAIADIDQKMAQYKLNEALMAIYKLIWDDFCAWYLEMIKPVFGEGIDPATYQKTLNLFEQLMKLLHPFMPFITEEIYQNLRPRKNGDFIAIAQMPEIFVSPSGLIEEFESIKEIIANVRTVRNDKGISPKEKLDLVVKGDDGFGKYFNIISKLANIEELSNEADAPAASIGFVVKGIEYYVPLSGKIDESLERKKVVAELEYMRGFLNSVSKKLQNERFVQNAKPEVIGLERQKVADAEAKIKALEMQLRN
jgi:valyl-tRNA synthetase